MAHIAKIDENNIVVELISVSNEELGITEDLIHEQTIINQLQAWGMTGTFVQYHSMGEFRGVTPIVGSEWDAVNEVFTYPIGATSIVTAYDYYGEGLAISLGYGPDDFLNINPYGHIML